MTFAIAAAVLVLAQAKVAGVVTYDGANPAAPSPDMRDPACPKEAQPRHPLVLGTDRGLGEVLVRVRPGAAAQHRASVRDATLDEDVELSFEKCRLRPRVLALLSGQTLSIENRDATVHDFVATSGTARVFSRAFPPGAHVELVPEAAPGSRIEARCRVHGETATILVEPHPYFAVTDADGVFEIDFVPEGAHTLEAFHPKLGWQRQPLTIKNAKPSPRRPRFEFHPPR